MPRNTIQADSVAAEEERRHSSAENQKEIAALRSAAREIAANLGWVPGTRSSDTFSKRCATLSSTFETIFDNLDAAFAQAPNLEDLLWLRDNQHPLSSVARALGNELGPMAGLPHVRIKTDVVPRVLAMAEAFFRQTGYGFSENRFLEFYTAFEEITPLEFHEIGALVPALKLVLLEQIADRATRLLKDLSQTQQVAAGIRTFRDMSQAAWEELLESLIPFDNILRQDPAAAFAAMDLESRNIYREKVARVAQHSDRTEMEVAEAALALARKAHEKRVRDHRVELRESHIGYYLVSDGLATLWERVGFHPPAGERLRAFLRRHPDEFLLFGISILTLAIIAAIVWLLVPAQTSPVLVLLSMFILLLPSSQAAVQLMNYLTTNLMPVDTLPKLDFSEGIPDDCVTMVAIPTLLLNEQQVHDLVEGLEVRYLGNHDRNMHFAVVSDLSDSDHPADEDNALVTLCSKLISELNERYASQNAGSFFLLHRHRVYNPRERGWMGWERKRGKLLDLNQLLRGQYDSFPVKEGDLSILSTVRFVITLDTDTELPRGSAHRMVGAIAHPLNQAIIDPEKNIVVAGYGILQPRVGVSVLSTARSRLAAIFAGETGLDPYTHATSDVYQDLYGEGTFTGKGIYEVDTMLSVLHGRFPRNALLSHDLIEGAYARAGLISDVIVIEDYPSHYSAYNRRKHRWLRGDWQIVQWLTDHVPDESGARVRNPISLLSRWKILDNLRRSLVEPATFVLLLFGWMGTSHPILWTLATICILFVPALFEFAFALTRAVMARQFAGIRSALSNLFAANFTALLTLTLLLHQTLLSVDAVVRAIVRYTVTHERLLEWETAAEAEIGSRRAPFDRYIDWMPLIAVVIGLVIWLTHPWSMLAATPVLVLWACSKLIALWLNASPLAPPHEITRKDLLFLRNSTLHIWRYFAEFSSAEHHWLVPDNIQNEPRKVAASISPTNVGLLLNARQSATEFGYITVPEMVDLTQKTLGTVARLSKYRGHLLNWYDTRTLEPKPPFFISSVDSGNLVASLWTLQHGCLDRLEQPLVPRALAEGFQDYLRALVRLRAVPKRAFSRMAPLLAGEDWLTSILSFSDEMVTDKKPRADSGPGSDTAWFQEEALCRLKNVREIVNAYMPWRLPEFAPLQERLLEGTPQTDDVPLQQLPDLIAEFEIRLDRQQATLNGSGAVADRLKILLQQARANALRLIDDLRNLSRQAGELANAMDFSFLLDQKRLQISVGFDAQSEELQPYFYDLLATEPRTAVFVAIAKEDIPQDCWFRLGRPCISDHGRPVLLSWTGTMFEYLMPSIWLRSYPNTLLDRTSLAAVRSQQEYATSKGIPWGISESACFKKNEVGDYHYEAFGVPTLALKKNESEPLVVSPYSTFLALNVDGKGALANLRRAASLGWFGSYGFYEAADYTSTRKRLIGRRFELVKSWMVHHQGMSLLSLTNFFCDNIMQRWFHSDRRVQATELLLQERPVSHVPV